jgi:hypothetical protein
MIAAIVAGGRRGQANLNRLSTLQVPQCDESLLRCGKYVGRGIEELTNAR